MSNSFNSAVIFNFNDTSIVHGIFEDNLIAGSIGTAGGRGIDGALAADDSANVRLRIDGNTVTGMRGEGMFFNANNTATLNIQVTNNNITTTPIVTSVFENLTVQASSLVANSADIVAKIEGNTVKQGPERSDRRATSPKRSACQPGPRVPTRSNWSRAGSRSRRRSGPCWTPTIQVPKPVTIVDWASMCSPRRTAAARSPWSANGTLLQPIVP